MKTIKYSTSTDPNYEGAVNALKQLGVIDKSAIGQAELLPHVDLVPTLLDYYQSRSTDDVVGAPPSRQVNVLCRLGDQGFGLSWGWPYITQGEQSRAAGGCLVLYPLRLSQSRFLAIVSSRISRDFNAHRHWFEALRTSVLTKSENLKLLSAVGTSTHKYLRRLAELVDADFVSIGTASKEKFKDALLHATCDRLGDRPDVVMLPFAFKPNIDDLVIDTSEEVRVLHVRRGGNIANAIERRLNSNVDYSRILLKTNENESPDSCANELIEKGAIPWLLFHADHGGGDTELIGPRTGSESSAPILSVRNFDSSKFFAHFTRGRYGPAPGETDYEFIDDLIFGKREGGSHSIGTLCRILASQRIMSTNNVTRDETPVVCFTSIPFVEFPEKRVYRPHVGRWDFEPYGIAIDRRWLTSRGLRPVIYGENEKWESLPRSDRPFFQKARSSNIDWRGERELRVVGDVDLSKVGSDMAVAFVPTRHDARVAAAISRWPVVVIAEP